MILGQPVVGENRNVAPILPAIITTRGTIAEEQAAMSTNAHLLLGLSPAETDYHRLTYFFLDI